MPFLPLKHLGRHRCYPESYHSSNFGFDTLTRHRRPLRTLCRRAIPSSMRGVRGVKDTDSVNLSGLSCAKVGVILRQTSFLLVPSSDFSMGSSLFTAVRMALATARRHIPVVGSPSRGRLYYHPYDYSRGNFLLRHIDSTTLRHWDPTVDGQPLFRSGVIRGVKDAGSVNLSGLSCAKVGVILRQSRGYPAPNLFSLNY